MTQSEIIAKAKLGGYEEFSGKTFNEALMDLEFWKALSRGMGWRSYEKYRVTHYEYVDYWHDLIDVLADGHKAEIFFDRFL